jgi:hypothetical protein
MSGAGERLEMSEQEAEFWKGQADSWQDKFGKMVEIRDKFAAQLREVEQERDALRELLREQERCIIESCSEECNTRQRVRALLAEKER